MKTIITVTELEGRAIRMTRAFIRQQKRSRAFAAVREAYQKLGHPWAAE